MSNMDGLAKQLAKQAKRLEQERQIARMEAERWKDKKHRARPTDERRKFGAWELRNTDDAGVRFAIDTETTRLDHMHNQGLITAGQRDAGIDFADLMARTRLVSQGRSCINFDPVGHDGDDEDHAAAAHRDRKELYLTVGTYSWAELQWVCVDQQEARDIARLRVALDLCEKFFR